MRHKHRVDRLARALGEPAWSDEQSATQADIDLYVDLAGETVRSHRRVRAYLEAIGAPWPALERVEALLAEVVPFEQLTAEYPIEAARRDLQQAIERSKTWESRCASGHPSEDDRATWANHNAAKYRRLYAPEIARIAALGSAFDPGSATLGELVTAYVGPEFTNLATPGAYAYEWLQFTMWLRP